MSRTFWKIFLWIYFVFVLVGFSFAFIISPLNFGDSLNWDKISMFPLYLFSFYILYLYAFGKRILTQDIWKIFFALFIALEITAIYLKVEGALLLQVFVLFVFYKYAFKSFDIWDDNYVAPEKKEISIISRIFDIRKMAKSLKNKEIKKVEFYAYIVLFIVFTTLSLLTDSKENYTSELLFYAFGLSSLVFLVAIFVVAYVLNGKKINKEFWYKTVCLNVPLIVLGFLFGVFWFMLSVLFFNLNLNSDIYFLEWRDFYFVNIISFFLLYLFYKYMKKLTNNVR